MSRSARRILIPLIVAVAAFGVLLAILKAPGPRAPATAPATTQPIASPSQPATAPKSEESAAASTPTAPPPAEVAPLVGLRAVAPPGETAPGQPAQGLGSLDPRRDYLKLELTRQGAGIAAIPFSDFWETAAAKRKARAYLGTLRPDEPFDLSQVVEAERYVLQTQRPYFWNGKSVQVPLLAAHSILVNGTTVGLLQESVWSQTAPGEFRSHIVNTDNVPLLEITRQFSLQANAPYEIVLRQRARNLSDQPLQIRWTQYGPTDLRFDQSGYIDRRRFVFGYLPMPKTDPNYALAGDDDLALERPAAIKQASKAEAFKSSDPAQYRQRLTIWPNQTSISHGFGLSWFASTNRYFGLAVHPVLDGGGDGASLERSVQEIRIDVSTAHGNPDEQIVFTGLYSPLTTLAAGAETSFDLGIYAGPLDRHLLAKQPFGHLNMEGMIVYRMAGGCCTFLTFQWLARFLLWFLSFLHSVSFDWGLAIIGLVIVVRALLHPLTKKSQVSIQRFGKQMSAMKPEIDKLQKKFKNDPKRMQQEQLKLMREHGVNPFQMLGCLPMFLQMPIWIALWAMLYLAFDIRQQPAFYGIFQLIGNWQFLADLAIADNFIVFPGFTLPLFGLINSVNLLPLLMGLVFFFQQKYMSPPATATMTPEQQQQQKIMKVMMVVMMPLFLYKAPSGLTLYILTSSCIGILESKYIRRHMEEIDKAAGGEGAALKPGQPKTPKLPRNPRFRAWAEALERARQRAQQRKSEPQRTFKKRK
jgi:YidC/Oxa1 family membrane protein insertase